MENVGSAGDPHLWWGLASAAQLGLGIRSYRKGCDGMPQIMPLKAFAVASLFVGAAASASIGILHFAGLHKVEDFIKLGANTRTRLGITRRIGDK